MLLDGNYGRRFATGTYMLLEARYPVSVKVSFVKIFLCNIFHTLPSPRIVLLWSLIIFPCLTGFDGGKTQCSVSSTDASTKCFAAIDRPFSHWSRKRHRWVAHFEFDSLSVAEVLPDIPGIELRVYRDTGGCLFPRIWRSKRKHAARNTPTL